MSMPIRLVSVLVTVMVRAGRSWVLGSVGRSWVLGLADKVSVSFSFLVQEKDY